jgi:hypothetical protein
MAYEDRLVSLGTHVAPAMAGRWRPRAAIRDPHHVGHPSPTTALRLDEGHHVSSTNVSSSLPTTAKNVFRSWA